MKARRLMAIPSEWTLRLTHSEARRDQCAHVAERRGLLSPEFIFGVFVTLKLAKLNRVAVNNAPKVSTNRRVARNDVMAHRCARFPPIVP